MGTLALQSNPQNRRRLTAVAEPSCPPPRAGLAPPSGLLLCGARPGSGSLMLTCRGPSPTHCSNTSMVQPGPALCITSSMKLLPGDHTTVPSPRVTMYLYSSVALCSEGNTPDEAQVHQARTSSRRAGEWPGALADVAVGGRSPGRHVDAAHPLVALLPLQRQAPLHLRRQARCDAVVFPPSCDTKCNPRAPPARPPHHQGLLIKQRTSQLPR